MLRQDVESCKDCNRNVAFVLAFLKALRVTSYLWFHGSVFHLYRRTVFMAFLLGLACRPAGIYLPFRDFLCPRDSNPGRGDGRRSFAVPAPEREEEKRERERERGDLQM